ncbi:hypothetical protein ACO1O0_003886 [Amphichorda felina]
MGQLLSKRPKVLKRTRDDSAYLAKPIGKCCRQGTVHRGDARGSWEVISGVETYLSKPPEGRANGHVLLYFPDAWGLFPNALLVMDAFADAGFLTLGLDYFRGDPIWKHLQDPPGAENNDFDYEAWKDKHTAFADEAAPKWAKDVAERYRNGDAKFFCVGYCFGAPYVCDELAGDTVTAGAFAHPAFLMDHHFENSKKPMFLSCCEVDPTFDGPSRRRALDILQGGEKTYHYQLFSGVQHGFAVRGDPDDPYQRWVKEQSLAGIVGWFNYWSSQ